MAPTHFPTVTVSSDQLNSTNETSISTQATNGTKEDGIQEELVGIDMIAAERNKILGKANDIAAERNKILSEGNEIADNRTSYQIWSIVCAVAAFTATIAATATTAPAPATAPDDAAIASAAAAVAERANPIFSMLNEDDEGDEAELDNLERGDGVDLNAASPHNTSEPIEENNVLITA
jgi:hypothetical protein